MKVLSLFDGMSCGHIALDRLGINVDTYYSSEIDKYALEVSQANYPNIIQLGDILNWQDWDIDWKSIDLVTGGFPCQSWSVAGKGLGDRDDRGKLFWVMLDVMKKVMENNPSAYYLMENVRMKKEFEEYITIHTESALPNVNKYMINSALVSAQNRIRFYWTNIKNVEQPEDKGIVLKDILENDAEEPMYSNIYGGFGEKKPREHFNKSITIRANSGGGAIPNVKLKPIRVGMNIEKVKVRKHKVDIEGLKYLLRQMKTNSGKTNKQIAYETNMPVTKVEHWFRTDSSFAIPSDHIWLKLKEVLDIQTDIFDKQIIEFEYRDGVYESTQRVYSDEGKSPTLTASNKEQMIETKGIPQTISINKEKKQLTIKEATKKGYTVIEDGDCFDMTFPNSKTRRGRNMKDKSNCLTAANYDYMRYEHTEEEKEVYWRKLSVIECMRLQTVPDDYLMPVSNHQKYKLLGNGWTVDVICHILKKINNDI